MATKKRTTKRRKRSLSQGLPLSKRGKRRTTRRRKTGLSEMFNPATATATGKTVLSGLIGGGAYHILNKLIKSDNTMIKGGTMLAASFIAGAVLKMPNVAAGISGAFGSQLADKIFAGGLSEMEEYDYATELEQLPEVLSESGEPMYLTEIQPLSEFEQANLYPQYVNTSMF